MPETTVEMETIKNELSDVSAFVKEHVEPAHDERVRLRKAIEALTTEQKEYRRASVRQVKAKLCETVRTLVATSWTWQSCGVFSALRSRS